MPKGSTYKSAQLIGNVSDVTTGAEIRFLGYGALNFSMANKGETSRYIRCAAWKLSKFVPSYSAEGDGKIHNYRYGFEFGSYADYVNRTNSGIKHAAPSVCSGDSGGPIFVKHGGRFKLLGLNSSSSLSCEVLASATGADLRLASSFLLNSPIQDLRSAIHGDSLP